MLSSFLQQMSLQDSNFKVEDFIQLEFVTNQRSRVSDSLSVVHVPSKFVVKAAKSKNLDAILKYIVAPESLFTHKLLITIDANSGIDRQLTQDKSLMRCLHNHVFGRENKSAKPLSSKRLYNYNFHYISVVLTHIDELVNFKKDFEDLKEKI